MTVTASAPVDRDGQVALPAVAREALHVETGAPVDVEVLGDGVVLLRGGDPDQAWFWAPEWQDGEQDADDDLTHGRYTTFDSEDAFAEALATLPAVDDPV